MISPVGLMFMKLSQVIGLPVNRINGVLKSKSLKLFDNKGIYIFGAGAIGIEIKRFLKQKSIFIAG